MAAHDAGSAKKTGAKLAIPGFSNTIAQRSQPSDQSPGFRHNLVFDVMETRTLPSSRWSAEGARMNDVLRTILATQKVITAVGIQRPLHSNIGEAQGEFLQKLIRAHKPRRSLEIGCAYGISSLYICEALSEVGAEKHIIIDYAQFLPHGNFGDPNSGWEGIGLENIKRAGHENLVEFHEARSHECLPTLLKNGTKIDFAFVDGNHTFDYVMVDFFFIDKLLRVGGIIVFDDIGYPSIRKVCRYILTNMRYSAVGPSVIPPKVGVRSVIRSLLSASLPRTLLKPELIIPDETVGLPASYVALRKEADDLIGIGPNTRCWDTHNLF
jgi:predicted O-methyltransferase YrrM